MSTPAPPADSVPTLIGRGALYSIATALQLVVAIAVLPAATRLLSADAYGVIAVAVVVQLSLALVAAAGLPDMLPRTYFRPDDGPLRAASLVALAIGTSTAVAAVAELTGRWWSEWLLGIEYGSAMRLAVWSSVAVAVLLTSQALLRAEDRAAAFLVTAAVATAGAQVVGLAFVVAWERSPTAYLAGVLLGTAAAAVASVFTSGLAVRPLADTSFVRATLAVSSPVVLNGLSLYLIWAGNRVVLSRIEGAAAAARFQVAFLVGGLTVLFISAVYSAWSPIVLGAPEKQRWQTLADTTRAVYRLAAAAAAAVAVGAPVGLAVLAPPEYELRDLVGVSAIVAVSAVPFAAYCARLHVLLWHGRTRALALVTTSVAIVNVALTVALVHLFGLEGAAVATVASYALLALLVSTVARGLADVPSTRGALLEALVVVVAAAAVSVLVPSDGAWLALHLIGALALLSWLVHTARRLSGGR